VEHVVGYSLFNDASVRDFQLRTPQWTMGKNFDGTGAFGPWLVTPDAVPLGARGLRIQGRLNGRVMQDSRTDLLLFSVAALIEMISVAITLERGDVRVFRQSIRTAHRRYLRAIVDERRQLPA
jgi:acylpyruvate hydrolase